MSDNNEATNVEPSESTGLLDGVQAQDEGQDSEAQAKASEVDHRAAESKADETTKERPDYWPENFWNKDKNEPDMEGIAKSWSDLRKQISQGKHKAPPDGKYDTSIFGKENLEGDPIVPQVLKWAQKHGISQSAFDDLVKDVRTGLDGYEQPGTQIDPAAEKKALGKNADAVINGMVSWARGLVNKGVWSAEDFDEFKSMGSTARGIKALMKLRESYEGRIPVESAPMEGMPTDVELQAMVGDPKYQSDPAYRQKVERLFNQRYGS